MISQFIICKADTDVRTVTSELEKTLRLKNRPKSSKNESGKLGGEKFFKFQFSLYNYNTNSQILIWNFFLTKTVISVHKCLLKQFMGCFDFQTHQLEKTKTLFLGRQINDNIYKEINIEILFEAHENKRLSLKVSSSSITIKHLQA